MLIFGKGGLMDKIDAKLMRLLAEDADVTTSSLVSKLNLSVPAINKRIARLKANGIVKKTTILTDARKIGKDVMAFVMIVLENFNCSDGFLKFAEEDPDILECYAIAGEYDYIIKICATDIDALEDKLLKMKKNGIAKSSTMFALREYKFEPAMLPAEK